MRKYPIVYFSRCLQVFLLLAGVHQSLAQTTLIDSLERVAAAHPRDTIGIKAWLGLSSEFARKDLVASRQAAHRAIRIAHSLNTTYGLSGSYAQLTSSWQNSGRLDSASHYLHLIKRLSEEESTVEVNGNYYMTAGLFYKNLSQFDLAIPFMLKALEHMTAPRHKLNRAGQLLNIGNAYHHLGDLRSASDYHLQALKEFEALDSKRGQSFCLQSLGNDFLKLERFDESAKYYEQSILLKQELGDERGLISGWIGLGDLHTATSSYEKSLSFFEKALAQSRKLKLAGESANALFGIGLVYSKMDNPAKARASFVQALPLARQRGDSLLSSKILLEMNSLRVANRKGPTHVAIIQAKVDAALQSGDRLAQADGYLRLSDWYWQNKEYDKAYTQLKKYYAITDSVRSEAIAVEFKKIEQAYQQEKNEREIALLKKDRELKAVVISRQKANQQIIAIILVSVFVFGFILINHLRLVGRSRRREELERMRNSIARDLHDDIGSALSSIHITSQVAMREGGESVRHLLRISESSARMMEGMSDIVWSINPENDSLDRVIVKMKEFAAEILEPKGIRYEFRVGQGLTSVKLDVEKRKNLFLIFKESLNNAAKYSEGSEVIVVIRQEGNDLQLSIADNGKGFDAQAVRRGNGLTNMVERARLINAVLRQRSQPGMGTEISAIFPIT